MMWNLCRLTVRRGCFSSYLETCRRATLRIEPSHPGASFVGPSANLSSTMQRESSSVLRSGLLRIFRNRREFALARSRRLLAQARRSRFEKVPPSKIVDRLSASRRQSRLTCHRFSGNRGISLQPINNTPSKCQRLPVEDRGGSRSNRERFFAKRFREDFGIRIMMMK